MTVLDGGLAGGRMNAAVANDIGKLVADFTGRGPTRSRAFLYQDMVVCLLENGAAKAEVNLVAAGKSERVRLQRDALQRAIERTSRCGFFIEHDRPVSSFVLLDLA